MEAELPPLGPYARRRPNSARRTDSPAILRNLFYLKEFKGDYLLAFVAIRQEKLIRFVTAVSNI